MFYGYYYDPTYIFIIIGAVITAAASAYVQSAFSRYSHSRTARHITGAQAAEMILHSQGIYDVRIVPVRGRLTDYYNPSDRTLHLSDEVYGSDSVSAVSVAAHECGHAVQHATGYRPLIIRSRIVPVVNFGSMLSWPLIVIGLFLNGTTSDIFLTVGLILFCFVIVFQLVTLPVELNASSRAMTVMDERGMLAERELSCAKKVLRAAALTYVASLAASVLQLLRLLVIIGGKRRDN